jgi:hypothetical protein
MQESYSGFANLISDSAKAVNATWPNFTIPNFELHAENVRLQAGTEVLSFTMYVKPEEEDSYLEYVGENYEAAIKEGHLIRYGNLDRLDPVYYHPYFTVVGPEGLVPDTMERVFRGVLWQFSPRTLLIAAIALSRYHPLHLMLATPSFFIQTLQRGFIMERLTLTLPRPLRV